MSQAKRESEGEGRFRETRLQGRKSTRGIGGEETDLRCSTQDQISTLFSSSHQSEKTRDKGKMERIREGKLLNRREVSEVEPAQSEITRE